MKNNLNKQPEGRSTVEQASACLIPVTEKDHLINNLRSFYGRTGFSLFDSSYRKRSFNKQPKGRSTGIIGFILFDRN